MSLEEKEPTELSRGNRLSALVLGGLCLGAGLNLMIGNEEFVTDAAGVLLATAGKIGLIVGTVRPDHEDPGHR